MGRGSKDESMGREFEEVRTRAWAVVRVRAQQGQGIYYFVLKY